MNDEVPDIHRRRLIGGVAVVGGAWPLLAGCGSDEETSNGADPDPADGEDSPDSTGSGESGRGGYTVETSAVPEGGGTIFREGLEPGQEIVVTQPQQGTFRAFSAICTHKQCVVARVDDQGITCTCHHSYYDPETGEVTGGPAPEPLPEKSVEVDGDTLTVS